jgi:molybdate transport system substrate-binding protein
LTIKGISSMAMRHVLAESCAAYAQQTGRGVEVVSVGGVDAAQRVQRGDAFDFVVLAADAIEQLAAARHVDAQSRTDLARSEIAVAVASGAPRPDLGSERSLRDALLRARTVGYSTGPSGAHLLRLFTRWGIADAIASRLVRAAPGVPVGTLIARGDVELGFQQSSELMHLPGVDVVGPLPADVQQVTIFCAAVCAVSQQVEATKALIAFLASPAAEEAKRRHGMAPAGRCWTNAGQFDNNLR